VPAPAQSRCLRLFMAGRGLGRPPVDDRGEAIEFAACRVVQVSAPMVIGNRICNHMQRIAPRCADVPRPAARALVAAQTKQSRVRGMRQLAQV
jgi:hypothetical protein